MLRRELLSSPRSKALTKFFSEQNSALRVQGPILRGAVYAYLIGDAGRTYSGYDRRIDRRL